MTYFHGGARGRNVGDLLLPPDVTGAGSLREYTPDGVMPVTRTDHVYMTSSEDEAAFFALLTPGGGSVYEVEPEGATEPDPDYSGPNTVVSAPAARVVRKVRNRVILWKGATVREALAALTAADGKFADHEH